MNNKNLNALIKVNNTKKEVEKKSSNALKQCNSQIMTEKRVSPAWQKA